MTNDTWYWLTDRVFQVAQYGKGQWFTGFLRGIAVVEEIGQHKPGAHAGGEVSISVPP